MTATHSARIFLADNRAIAQTKSLQTQSVFLKNKQDDTYELDSFFDHLMAPGASAPLFVPECCSCVLLPVSGALHFKVAGTEGYYLAAGQLQIHHPIAGIPCTIINPFQEDFVNFLQVNLRTQPHGETSDPVIFTYADLNLHQNEWVTTNEAADQAAAIGCRVSIGKFAGRGEAVYKSASSRNNVFLYVIQGAFETDGCLLHERDGLLLSGKQTYQTEALSNEAIQLVIESIVQ